MKNNKQVLTSELRDKLKVIMQKEIENLPKTLVNLEPRDRINAVIKLMPYVFPKIETVSLIAGEPNEYAISWEDI